MPYELSRSPRKWQKEALAAWRENDQRGIAQVVTGGGKTVFGFMCANDALAAFDDLRIGIVVPSVALLDQWYVDLQDDFGVPTKEIQVVGPGARPNPDARFYLVVINTARKNGIPFPNGDPTMLIVDEVHRAGAEQSRHALEGDHVATLGLSATPEREYDDALEEVLIPHLGPVIFRYDYAAAHKDKVIADFNLLNVEVPLTTAESDRYSRLSSRVGVAYRESKVTGDESKLKRLLQQRATLSANAKMRVPTAVAVANQHRGRRIVIFHESIQAATEIAELLRKRQHNVALYHSKIGDAMRRDNLRLFRRGEFDILVSCRALDEGVNVPETEVGIIASSTASSRQRIQRLGRLLRPAPGKDTAEVYTLFATEVEEKRLRSEAEGLSGAASVAWKKVRVNG